MVGGRCRLVLRGGHLEVFYHVKHRYYHVDNKEVSGNTTSHLASRTFTTTRTPYTPYYIPLICVTLGLEGGEG